MKNCINIVLMLGLRKLQYAHYRDKLLDFTEK